MNENIKEKLQAIKTKEDYILSSKERQTKIEKELKKLNNKKKKITNKRKIKLEYVLRYITYDIIMMIIIIIFVKYGVDKLKTVQSITKNLYIIAIYAGVITICISGAIISNKIDILLKQKKMLKIINSIKNKQEKLNEELKEQEKIQKEIKNIQNTLLNYTNYYYDDNYLNIENKFSKKETLIEETPTHNLFKKTRIRKIK